MKTFVKSFAAATLLSLSVSAFADVAVVVHPSNSNSLDKTTIARIFLGKKKTFPDGSQALPVSQKAGNAASKEFADKVLGKSPSQLKAYWSKLVFTGKGTPPDELDNDAAVLEAVAKNPSVIGFVDAASVNGNVKVVGKY